MPARTRSAGIWPTTTARHCRGPRSTGSWSGPARSPRSRPSGPSPPTSASKPTQPNECWQSDFTHYRLTRPDGTPGADTEILTWLDDCSRYALHVTAHPRVTGPIVLATFRETVAAYGIPASTLTDNGMVFTTRLAGGQRRPQRLGDRTTPPGHRPEELPPEPPHHLRQGRTLPADDEELAARPTRPASHPRRAADPARAVRRDLQPPPPAPLAPAPRHPGNRLHCTAQSHPDQRPRPPTPTTASAATRSTKPASSPCASTADCTTSASAEPTPEPPSSCSSKTSTSASSTPPPANSSANSPSTPDATTSPPDDHPAHTEPKSTAEPANRRSGCRRCLETSHVCGPAGFEPATP